jgi:hypothetical protein
MKKPLEIWERNTIIMHPYSLPMDVLIQDALHHYSEENPGPGIPAGGAEHLADSHPLKRQAILVMDALESVTNGMENPDVFDKLDDIPRESPFHAWISLVSALRAFYHGDPEEMVRKLDEIPPETPPKVLSRVLLHLSSLDLREGPLTGIEQRLVQSVENPGGLISETLLQISEALESNREEIFSDAVAYLAKELYVTMPEISKRLFLWALAAQREKGWDDDILAAYGKLIFGIPESERLLALSYFDTAPEAALLYWSRFRKSVAGLPSGRPDTDTLEKIENFLSSRTIRRKQVPRGKPGQLELFF